MLDENKTASQNNQIELRSDEVKEIMGKPPHWMIRNGMGMILLSFLLIFTGSYFFRFPDVIKGTITITSENPPASLIARSSGKISALLVVDNQKVARSSHLAIIENPANIDDMDTLVSVLDTFSLFFSNENQIIPPEIPLKSNFNLGECQETYAAFTKHLGDYLNFIRLNYYPKKIQSLEEEIQMHNQYVDKLNRQKNILNENLILSHDDFIRDSILYSRGIIPQADFEKRKSEFLKHKYEFESAQNDITGTRIKMKQLEQQKLDMHLKFNESSEDLLLLLKESYENLSAAIDIWEQKYVIKSPVDGIVTFNRIWSEHQNVIAGEIVMTIVPENEEMLIGKLLLPLKRSGKVKSGQKVNIKFNNYPYMEYGMVHGMVEHISLVPENNYYMVRVSMPEGLKSSYGKTLDFVQEMQGTAEIITDDKRLIERIFNPLKSLVIGH